MQHIQFIVNRYLPRSKENKNFSICLTCFHLPPKEWESIKAECVLSMPKYTFSWGKKPGVLFATFNDSKQNNPTL